MSEPSRRTRKGGALLGAAFLMATSAIGPGFLTQTAVFTQQLGASFGFAILVSILFDLGAQLNVWRVIAAAERPAQEIADQVVPGLGKVLVVLVSAGGLAFNIGNVAGAGLGLQAMFGLPVAYGAAVSAVIAIGIFVVREAGRMMDRFAQLMGAVMVVLTVYVAWASHPPLGAALGHTFAPEKVDALAVMTIVGGTVGGYITFAGAHRLLDAGIARRDAMPAVTRSAGTGIGIASLMRVLLFLAALGVVAAGHTLDAANPPASVFDIALGEPGYRLFGVVMWAAAITSVVGSAYTSVSFLKSASRAAANWPRMATIAFIVVSTAVFLTIGRPVKTLILVGALNGLILPVSLGTMLVAANRSRIVGAYRHPKWLTVAGAVVALCMAGLGAWTLASEVPKLFGR